ncbi:hypothetical protein B0H19DRAFT_78745 [Mycena capillaripes]|nr:hypothetical protein B0H19DRAFT_78745 [Mycena capillaripes]
MSTEMEAGYKRCSIPDVAKISPIPELLGLQAPPAERSHLRKSHNLQRRTHSRPQNDSPTRIGLLRLAFNNTESPHAIPLSVRACYVDSVERTYDTHILEPYRTMLVKWPVSHPPPGIHCPHAVRFHAATYCPLHMHECHCTEWEVGNVIPHVATRDLQGRRGREQSADGCGLRAFRQPRPAIQSRGTECNNHAVNPRTRSAGVKGVERTPTSKRLSKYHFHTAGHPGP